MNKLIAALLLWGIFLLCSCTSLELPIHIPAEYDIGKGTRVSVESEKYFFTNIIKDDLVAELNESGYYENIDSSSSKKSRLILALERGSCDIINHITSYTSTDTDSDGNTTEYTVEIITYSANARVYFKIHSPGKSNNPLLYKTFGTDTDEYSSSRIARNIASYILAYKIACHITPHIDTEKIRIWSRRKNPYVKMAAVECKNNNWTLAKTYAEEAVKLTPEEPEANYLMGVIEQALLNFDSADKYFCKASSLGTGKKYNKAITDNKNRREMYKVYSKQMKLK